MMPARQIVARLSPTSLWWVMALLGLLTTGTFGQVVWDNGNGNNRWGTSNNWNPNNLPTSASNVQFNASDNDATVSNITLDADRAANSLTFNNVNDSFSLLNGSGNRTLRLTSRTITRTAGSSGNQTLAFTTLAPQNDWDGGWTWNIGGSGSLAIQSNITGGWGTNVKSGAGTLVLSGNNTFGGITNINHGALVAASNTALGSSTYGNTIADGAALHLQNNITLTEQHFSVQGSGTSGTGAIRNVSGYNTLAATLQIAAPTTIVSAAGNLTLSGAMAVDSNLTTKGPGTITFAGSSGGYGNGNLTINQGTVVFNKSAETQAIGGGNITIGEGSNSAMLRLDASNQIGDNSAVAIGSGGTLKVQDFVSESIKTLSGTGLVDLSTSGYLSVGVNSGTSTFGGTITGSGTFDKIGDGTLTLTQDLSFDGQLDVSAGTLSLASGVDVDATLELSGGKLTLAGAISVDTLLVTQNSIIDFGGSSVLNLQNLTISNGVTLTIQNWANAADYFFTQNWTGAVFNVTGANPMAQIVFSGVSGNTKWQSYDHQITPVPEPSTYGALLLSALASAALIHRKLRRNREQNVR